MRFMMLMIPKDYAKAGKDFKPDAKMIAAMMKYNEALAKAGVLLALDGLTPPALGAHVTFQGGQAKVTEGPLPENKQPLGGYWMIQVASRQEAIEWAKRIPGDEGATVEVRQVYEMPDFPPEAQNAAENAAVKAAVEKHNR